MNKSEYRKGLETLFAELSGFQNREERQKMHMKIIQFNMDNKHILDENLSFKMIFLMKLKELAHEHSDCSELLNLITKANQVIKV